MAGNLVIDLPLRLHVSFAPGPAQPAVTVEPCGPGLYCVRYEVAISGAYSLSLLVGRERAHLRGSPFVLIAAGDGHDNDYLAKSRLFVSAKLAELKAKKAPAAAGGGAAASPPVRARSPGPTRPASASVSPLQRVLSAQHSPPARIPPTGTPSPRPSSGGAGSEAGSPAAEGRAGRRPAHGPASRGASPRAERPHQAGPQERPRGASPRRSASPRGARPSPRAHAGPHLFV